MNDTDKVNLVVKIDGYVSELIALGFEDADISEMLIEAAADLATAPMPDAVHDGILICADCFTRCAALKHREMMVLREADEPAKGLNGN